MHFPNCNGMFTFNLFALGQPRAGIFNNHHENSFNPGQPFDDSGGLINS